MSGGNKNDNKNDKEIFVQLQNGTCNSIIRSKAMIQLICSIEAPKKHSNQTPALPFGI